MENFGAVPFDMDILSYMQIGRWAFELDEGKEPRMYCDDVMCDLLGISNTLTPEENYKIWFTSIDPEYVSQVEEAVRNLIVGEYNYVEYPWYHPTNGRVYVRCSGIRNPSYTDGIRLEGIHREITKEVLSESETKKTLQEDLQAIQGLASEYNVLHFLNIKTDEYTSYFFDPTSPEEAVRMNNESKNYYDAHKESIPVFCHPDDLERIMKYGNKEYLIDSLRHKKKIVERFLCMNREGIYEWTDFILLKFDPIDDEPTRVAVGYVDVDAEQKQKLEAEKALRDAVEETRTALAERDEKLHMLQAIAGIYFSMHLIDLRENTVTEVSCDELIRPYFVSSEGADVIMKNIMTAEMVPEYRDDVLAFTDLATLPERMRGLKNYSSEAVGIHTGWFIANFVTVEADEDGKPVRVLFTTQVIDE